MPTITQSPDGYVFDCQDDETILRAALRAGIGMPYSCNTGSCGNCRFQLLDGTVTHLRDDAPAWSERELKRGRWLGCQAVPDGPCSVKFRTIDQYIPDNRPVSFDGELIGIEKITHDIAEFTFQADDLPGFHPGQYALLYVPGVTGGRAYSMSNLGEDGTWRLMIKQMPGGAATGALFAAELGAKITIDGPYGTAFLRKDSTRDIVLLAGGSGLSPMVSIAKGAAAAGMLDARKLHVFYGGRESGDLCDVSVLGAQASQKARFVAALSDSDTNWTGPKGYLHDVVADDMGAGLKDCEIYFAGPAVMSAAVQKMAHDAGVPQDQLHFDEFY
ncbi:MAG: toluene monooxygenase electron transfer component [Yoonia sp.]|jgi:toluene monooxygenase electron transfer component